MSLSSFCLMKLKNFEEACKYNKELYRRFESNYYLKRWIFCLIKLGKSKTKVFQYLWKRLEAESARNCQDFSDIRMLRLFEDRQFQDLGDIMKENVHLDNESQQIPINILHEQIQCCAFIEEISSGKVSIDNIRDKFEKLGKVLTDIPFPVANIQNDFNKEIFNAKSGISYHCEFSPSDIKRNNADCDCEIANFLCLACERNLTYEKLNHYVKNVYLGGDDQCLSEIMNLYAKKPLHLLDPISFHNFTILQYQNPHILNDIVDCNEKLERLNFLFNGPLRNIEVFLNILNAYLEMNQIRELKQFFRDNRSIINEEEFLSKNYREALEFYEAIIEENPSDVICENLIVQLDSRIFRFERLQRENEDISNIFTYFGNDELKKNLILSEQQIK
ncbi:MAG: hypothetical protein MHMPM18_003906, partial [Marteilia pararefringens]